MVYYKINVYIIYAENYLIDLFWF